MILINDSMFNNIMYTGASEKYGVIINNKRYILKIGRRDDTSSINEHIVSTLINCLGLNAHNTMLAKYDYRPAVLCEDFTYTTGCALHEFKETKQSSVDTDISNKEYTYKDVIYLIDKHIKMSDKDKGIAIEKFWQMYICDAIFGNRDRHWGNWGFLNCNGSYKFAPIYDNGNSLFPNIYNELINEKDKYKILKDLVLTKPASLLKVEGKNRLYRSNYYRVFGDLRISKVLSKNVKNLRNSLSYQQLFIMVKTLLDNTFNELSVFDDKMFYYKLSDGVLYRFWLEIILLRYLVIIDRIDFDKAFNKVEGDLNVK